MRACAGRFHRQFYFQCHRPRPKRILPADRMDSRHRQRARSGFSHRAAHTENRDGIFSPLPCRVVTGDVGRVHRFCPALARRFDCRRRQFISTHRSWRACFCADALSESRVTGGNWLVGAAAYAGCRAALILCVLQNGIRWVQSRCDCT